jgi:hypothetical protein
MNQEQITAEQLAKEIRDVAKKAHSEEDVRLNVEHVLSHALESLGIKHEPQYEKSLFSGSADAVYGHVLVEYKKPGRLAEKGFSKKLAEQISKYLLDLARKEGGRDQQKAALEKMVGIGLDGESIMFMRYSASGRKRELPTAPLPGTQHSFFDIDGIEGAFDTKINFQIIGPVPVGKESIELFLLFLRSLSRKPLTPESLAASFAPQSEVARSMVNALYHSLENNRQQPRVATFFAEWQRIFGIVYGEDVTDAEKDAPELAMLYGNVKGKFTRLQPMFFAVHTYYALLMKFLAVEFAALQRGALVGSFVTALPALPDERVRRELESLENGGTFALLGINNFLEGDFFGWYLNAWDDGLGHSIRQMARELADFEPATGTLEPEHTRDLLKKLYQYLIPKKLRHDLGEYYTPDWLAERLLIQIGYDGDIKKRLLDPACGSGTFPVLALRRLRQWAADHMIEPAIILKAALDNIVGFDLNPLSVIAARTNFLLALGDLLRYRESNIDLPIYLCDSILTPSASDGDMFTGQSYRLHTVVGDFDIPGETVETREMGDLAKLLEDCVKNDYSEEDFMARAKRTLSMKHPQTGSFLEGLFRKFAYLEREGRDGIWARLIKNAFAPVLVGQFDFIAGNPPWINWESLSQEYREATFNLWEKFNLFPHKGLKARLGSGKDDISVLMTYVAINNYLKQNGKLGFIITQTVFQSKGGGKGFRQFKLGDKEKIKVLHVDDMSGFQPFDGATNRTSIIVLEKGQATKYPVPYTVWNMEKGGSISIDMPLDDVIKQTNRTRMIAEPIDQNDSSSPWIVGKERVVKVLRKVVGNSAYQARAGTCTWANGIYWVDFIQELPDSKAIVKNRMADDSNQKNLSEAPIEKSVLFPLLRGRDIKRWLATPSAWIILPQDTQNRSKGIPESVLKVEYPLTFRYFNGFREILTARSGYKKFLQSQKQPFYSIYNVGGYTFSDYKVVWREQASEFTCTVIGKENGATIIPDHKLMLIPFDHDQELDAHFVCALLSSIIARLVVKSYVVEVSTSTHILENISIPKFNKENPLHVKLAKLSMKAHALTEKGEDVSSIETEIDDAAAKFWNISDSELAEIKKSLAGM